jgi:hypothetical protein
MSDDERTADERWVDAKVREAEDALMQLYLLRYGVEPEVIAAELAAIKQRAATVRG